ncbi:MAG TPA: hypothetical protein VM120_17085 [Bryobacteraceae bacterium]|nr:hypothetical protein [Bryobacteraceae bacterium]
MNRRSFLTSSLAGIAGRDLYGRPNSYAHEMPDMLVGWMSDRLKTLAKRWDAERESLAKPAQIEARNRFVRQKLGEMIHGMPERTPLVLLCYKVQIKKTYLSCPVLPHDIWREQANLKGDERSRFRQNTVSR